jgi:hypothetical protein
MDAHKQTQARYTFYSYAVHNYYKVGIKSTCTEENFDQLFFIFRCEEHLYKRLRRLVGPSVRRSVGWSVRWSVGPLVRLSVPTMQLRGKLVTSRLLREEEEEENWLRRDSFAPRD